MGFDFRDGDYGDQPAAVCMIEDMGITAGLLWKWKKAFDEEAHKGDAFRGQRKRTAAEERIRQLERENRLLKQDKETQKKWCSGTFGAPPRKANAKCPTFQVPKTGNPNRYHLH